MTGEPDPGARLDEMHRERTRAKVEAEGSPFPPTGKTTTSTVTLPGGEVVEVEVYDGDRIQEKARGILEKGNPVEAMVKAVQELHVGDTPGIYFVVAALGCTLCSNTQGLHPGATGGSGAGKTHLIQAFTHTVPREYCQWGSFADQTLYYLDYPPGSIVVVDDAQNTSIAQLDAIKQAMSQFQSGWSRKVWNAKKEKIDTRTISPRTVFAFTSVEGAFEDQVLNRQLSVQADEGEDHDELIFQAELKKAGTGETLFPESAGIQTVRAMWGILKGQRSVQVKIPFTEHIGWNGKKNHRNFPMFRDTIFAFAAINQFQREVKDGCLLAAKEDFDLALRFWNHISKEQQSKQNKRETMVMEQIIDKTKNPPHEVTQQGLLRALPNVTALELSRILKGRRRADGTTVGGLLNKIPGLDVESRAEFDRDTGITQKYNVVRYSGDYQVLENYENIAFWKEDQ